MQEKLVLNRFQVHVKVNLFILLYFYVIEKLSVGKFLGQRFIQNKDVSLILIYDSNGAIAGVQMGVSLFILLKIKISCLYIKRFQFH